MGAFDPGSPCVATGTPGFVTFGMPFSQLLKAEEAQLPSFGLGFPLDCAERFVPLLAPLSLQCMLLLLFLCGFQCLLLDFLGLLDCGLVFVLPFLGSSSRSASCCCSLYFSNTFRFTHFLGLPFHCCLGLGFPLLAGSFLAGSFPGNLGPLLGSLLLGLG